MATDSGVTRDLFLAAILDVVCPGLPVTSPGWTTAMTFAGALQNNGITPDALGPVRAGERTWLGLANACVTVSFGFGPIIDPERTADTIFCFRAEIPDGEMSGKWAVFKTEAPGLIVIHNGYPEPNPARPEGRTIIDILIRETRRF